jgi:hypothetical protein
MDEGTYLLKGRLFLEGQYRPFEENGLLTNKPLFSFWILGLSQMLSIGLRSGRYFAILLSIGVFIGLWFTSKKYLGLKSALFNSLLITINQAIIIYYSRAMTEVVTALLIIWSLYYILGAEHKKTELCFGLILAAIVLLTRQNLLPFFVFSLLYVIWENGFKKSLVPILLSISFFIAINIMYWPDIYTYIWEPLLPTNIASFLNNIFNVNVSGNLGMPYLDREYGLIQEMQVLFQTLRYYLIPIFTSIFAFLLIDWKKMKSGKDYKKCIFLLITFLSLILLHLLAPIINNVYLYSMPAYPSFFIPIGLLIFPFCIRYMRDKSTWCVTVIMILSIIIIFAGIGLSLYRTISEPLMTLKVPRVKNFSFQEGNIELWKLLSNKLKLDYFQLEYLVTTGFGFSFGILFILIAVIFWKIFSKREVNSPKIDFSKAIFLQFIILCVLLSPTKYMAGNSSINLCANGDVLSSHEKVAEQLKGTISDGSLVYYETNETSIPLMYLTEVNFYPNLLNQKFYFRIGGDDEYLEKIGYWNESLAFKWIANADYLVLGEEEAKYWEPRFGEFSVKFDKLLVTDNTIPCRDRTYLHVYKVIR